MMRTMKLVEYQTLSVNLKIFKKINQKIKRTRRQNRKIDWSNDSINQNV